MVGCSGANVCLHCDVILLLQITTNLRLAIEQVEGRVGHIRDSGLQWDAADQMKRDFEGWLDARDDELTRLSEQPEKLHADAARLEIERLQVLERTDILDT